MDVQSAFNAGVQGFQKATDKANQAAEDIAVSTAYDVNDFTADQENNITREIPDLTQSIVDLKVSEYQAKASANVIKTADENLGTLLDVSV